jgi:hypothetical protein
VAIYKKDGLSSEFLKSSDLFILSLGAWKQLINEEAGWLEQTPSLLIYKK